MDVCLEFPLLCCSLCLLLLILPLLISKKSLAVFSTNQTGSRKIPIRSSLYFLFPRLNKSSSLSLLKYMLQNQNPFCELAPICQLLGEIKTGGQYSDVVSQMSNGGEQSFQFSYNAFSQNFISSVRFNPGITPSPQSLLCFHRQTFILVLHFA